MRIAQVAPLYESVPPKGYGETEQFERLIAQNQEVPEAA